jgi:saccharopine dehydrogenase-like NADP-dependent oxidoreductase
LKHIVLFGAGKSSLFLIEYLTHQLTRNNWQLTVIDADLHAAQQKTRNAPNTAATSINVENNDERRKWIAGADIVISLLPPSLHFLVAQDCLQFEKNLLTASYVDQRLENLRPEIEKKGLLFLCEMGLDPGIDHMSVLDHLIGADNRYFSFADEGLV